MPDPVTLRVGTYVHSDNADLIALPRQIAANIAVTVAQAAGRTIALSTTGAVIGDRYAVDFIVASGQPIAIRNGSITGGLLHTLSGLNWARFLYDGAIWRREDSGAVSATG